MNVTLRFYWQHDLDLLTLAEDPRMKSISTLCKESLRAYVRNEEYEIITPKDLKKTTIDSKSTSFHLDSKKDADIIDFLTDIRVGFRCNAIKQITRSYISEVFLLPFYSELIDVKSRGHSFKKSKKNKKIKKEPIVPQKESQKEPSVLKENPKEKETKEKEPVVPQETEDSDFNVFDLIGSM